MLWQNSIHSGIRIKLIISPFLEISQQLLNVCYSSPVLSLSGKHLYFLKLKKSRVLLHLRKTWRALIHKNCWEVVPSNNNSVWTLFNNSSRDHSDRVPLSLRVNLCFSARNSINMLRLALITMFFNIWYRNL